jgi:glycosyltransferase involved in cell wall biosynthesis
MKPKRIIMYGFASYNTKHWFEYFEKRTSDLEATFVCDDFEAYRLDKSDYPHLRIIELFFNRRLRYLPLTLTRFIILILPQLMLSGQYDLFILQGIYRYNLVPHNDSEHTQTTVPHKLFQYMIAGKPVIVSDVRPLKRIIEETHSGLVFKANDPRSLAQALINLCYTPGLGEQSGHNGRQASTGPYAWRHDARRLINLYRKIEEE